MDENQNNISQISLQSVDESYFFHSTPHKPHNPSTARRKTFATKCFTFAAPAPVKLHHCPHCPNKKPYKTFRYFNQHMLQHKVEDICSKIPNLDDLLRNSPLICDRALTKMSSVPCFGEGGEKFKNLVHLVNERKQSEGWILFCQNVAEHFASSLQVKKFILPSALWASIFTAQESLLSSRSLRESLENALSAASKDSDTRTLQLFICEFVLLCSEEVLTFIRETIVPPQQKTLNISFGKEDRQTIHYIAGYIIHHFKKRAKMYPKNKDWQQILNVLKTKAIEGSDIVSASDCDREWSSDVNRGRLVFIGAKCMDFFMSVAAVCSKVANPNGTLLHAKVLEEVYSSCVPLKWDAMVGQDLLSEDLSLRLMNGLVKSFSQTFGKGLRSKKMNEANKKPYASVNLRHSVTPKKK